MIKITALLPRHPSLSRAEFIDYHRDRHAVLVANAPCVHRYVRRYEQSHAINGSLPGLGVAQKFDGVAELWFDDFEGLEAFYTDANYLELLRPDEEVFIDLARVEVLIGTVNPVL